MKYLITFIISMLPLVELRLAIPYGVMIGGNPWIVIFISVIGNAIPVPFIYFFARKILVWGADKRYVGNFFRWCLEKGEKAGAKLQKAAGRGGVFAAIMLFVGVPLPGTGAWTGTLAASFLDIEPKISVIAVICGIILSAFIMSVMSGLLYFAFL